MNRPRNDPPSRIRRTPVGVVDQGSTATIGSRETGGLVAVWLRGQGPWADPLVGVNVAYMTNLSVDIDLSAAAELRDALTALLERAGWPDRG